MGNPFVHLDLTCDDPDAAKKFYGSVFDWKFIEFPEMHWTGLDVGEGVGGGLGGKQSPDQPTAWTAYVDVADVKATLAKAESAGATIVVPHMAVGDMGWLGVFVDPQGATVGVWQSAKKPAAAKPSSEGAAKKSGKKAAKKTAAAKPAKKAAKKTAAAKRAKPASKKAAKKKAGKKK